MQGFDIYKRTIGQKSIGGKIYDVGQIKDRDDKGNVCNKGEAADYVEHIDRNH